MSNCCYNCFNDSFLVGKIKLDGKVMKCSLCSERRKCLDIEALQSIFLPLVSLYANVEELLPMEMLKDLAGEHPSLAEKVASDWAIFDDEQQAARFLELCQNNCNYKDDTRDMFDPMRSVDIEDFFYFGEYHKSSSLKDKWSELRQELQESNRFFAGRTVVKNIEEALNTDAIKMTLKKDVLYRVRATAMNVPYAKTEMGAPPAGLSTAGRANPAGIPYLYLASDQDTAICEVRPHANERLAVGSFRLVRPVTCIDLRNPDIGSPFQHGDKLHDVLSVIGFLRHLGHELSVPIGNQRRDHEYLPTQYLCEMIKNLGYDGVAYNSGLGKGYNIALFDPSVASCVEVKLVQVKSIIIVTNEFVL
jgi:hypothetical protein